MFENYLKVAVRNLIKFKMFSFLNISGLAIGMSCCILVFLYIQDEIGYDQFHEKSNRIYRVLREREANSGETHTHPGTSGALAPSLLKDFSEIQSAVRTWDIDTWINYKDKWFKQQFMMTDSKIFEIFSFPFVKGDPRTALVEPYTIVLTQEMANKFFPDEDPIGRTIIVEHRYFRGDYKITGVLKNIPINSTIQFDFLASSASSEWRQKEFAGNVWERWQRESGWLPIETFILLQEGYPPSELEQKLSDFMLRYMGEEIQSNNVYHLQPINRIHLYSNVDYGMTMYSDISYIYLLSTLAFFILLIAGINFVNLATARATTRAMEVGMRKVVGANRRILIVQFLGESFLLSLLALLLALSFVELFLPTFNAFTLKALSLNIQNEPLLVGLSGITVLVGLFSGIYPAFVLSAFEPMDILKGGKLVSTKNNARFRKGLVIFQSSISVICIIGTITIFNQMKYMRNKDLGFNKDQVMILELYMTDRSLTSNYRAIHQEFIKHPDILAATASHTLPNIGWGERWVVYPEGSNSDGWEMNILAADEDFLNFFDIKVKEGRNFSSDIGRDTTSAYILNETAVKQLGWEKPIGKQFEWNDRPGKVIGVVEDFHLLSLHEKIGPVFVCMWVPKWNYISLKIRKDNIANTIQFVENQWKRLIPNFPFNFHFLDENIDKWNYEAEIKLEKMLRLVSLLTIFVACLGLFGLTAFTVQYRTHEMSIRKVLGASKFNIWWLLVRDFLGLILLTNIIAWPIAFFVMEAWLQDFHYRVHVDLITLILGGGISLMIALLTIVYHTLKTALLNPIHHLRYK